MTCVIAIFALEESIHEAKNSIERAGEHSPGRSIVSTGLEAGSKEHMNRSMRAMNRIKRAEDAFKRSGEQSPEHTMELIDCKDSIKDGMSRSSRSMDRVMRPDDTHERSGERSPACSIASTVRKDEITTRENRIMRDTIRCMGIEGSIARPGDERAERSIVSLHVNNEYLRRKRGRQMPKISTLDKQARDKAVLAGLDVLFEQRKHVDILGKRYTRASLAARIEQHLAKLAEKHGFTPDKVPYVSAQTKTAANVKRQETRRLRGVVSRKKKRSG